MNVLKEVIIEARLIDITGAQLRIVVIRHLCVRAPTTRSPGVPSSRSVRTIEADQTPLDAGPLL